MVRLAATHDAWSEALDRCERRDPLGHAVHLGIGLLYMAVLPIGTAPAVMVSAMLLVVTVLRWRSVAPLLPALLRWAPAPVALLLAAWLAITLLWSTDAAYGAHLLLSMRVLLLPITLAPLLAHRDWLGGALLGGIALQALVQCVQYALHRGAWNFDGLARFGGFTSDPGKAGLWDAIGVCAGVTLAITLSRRRAWCGFALALVTLFATIASGTRRQLVAIAIAIPALMAWAFVVIPHRRRRVALLVLIGAVAVGASWPLVGPSIMIRLRQTASQISERAKPLDESLLPPISGIVHYDLRGYYWNAALEDFRASALWGFGLGSSGDAIASSSLRKRMEPWLRQELLRAYPERDAEETEREVRKRLESSHPHSTWLQLLVEGGLIGFVLGVCTWALAWAAALRRSMAMGLRDPVSLACSAALLLWAIGAIFDASINSTSLGAAVVLALLGGGPAHQSLSRRGSQSGSAGHDGR